MGGVEPVNRVGLVLVGVATAICLVSPEARDALLGQ